MKKELAFILFTVVIALAGCMGNRDKGNDYMEEDSIRISNVPDTAFYGHLGDGTGMSCLQLVTNEGDTLVLNKTDEKSGEDGRILGEIANYTDQFAITTRDDNQSISVALNINQLAQSWQSQTDSLHGFSLLPDGKAKAIKNKQYKYNRWDLCNCHLILLRESVGAHGAETRHDTLQILCLTPDSLVLQALHSMVQETFIHL